ncbi:thiamine biosynthesis protein thio [Thioclava dalianensis]|uniref:D-amino-acid oxidase n=1 Tax=Thioclava dalianensis TaxID=1185766 RepID=A0A074TQV1_9RHOB|nr:FAD-dependent oxidoreductase [Thioclava dalianensis]KEP71333.1 thiamine biosynthesis protein thio [Thioclava dalianensis]SFM77553.1 glycine oxidase [Thioclava dalianensis]
MISVLGAGVAGLCAATALAEAGHRVEVIVPEGAPPPVSHLAGGMLAPFCEGECAPEQIVLEGQGAVTWWSDHVPGVMSRGTLVLAPPRDTPELERFARATRGHDWVVPGALEPDLVGRFARGLFFANEAHMDPVAALRALREGLIARGVACHSGAPTGQIVDCRGITARKHLPDLRPVRGEMLELHAPDLNLTRPVRLLHPRFACYLVPRGQGRYMLGATMVETGRTGPITARAMMELLSAAYTVHPGFAEACVIATGAGLRPALPDNIPALIHQPDRIHVNGMYRHGFLMGPILAARLVAHFAQETAHAD